MNRRLVRWLLALYPRAWRDRYGPEVASLTGELISAGEATPLRAGLNLIAGAAIERERALARSRRAVLASAAAAITAAAGIALAVTHAHSAGGVMEPYFENHSVGVLLLVVVMCWFLMEFVEFLRVQESREWREGATKTGNTAGWWFVAGACAIAWETWLYLAPSIIPAATIRPGAVAFAVGMAILLAGIGLRLWSFKALGRYFTYAIMVSPDQPVVTNGPYRMVRHPSYTGGLLTLIGVGLMSANWVGLAAMTLLPLAVIVWRIHIEENALLTGLGDPYRCYASRHKRLVPLIW
jgi:protein-S-isoprenylcysteine O-methyltransferase Ste14